MKQRCTISMKVYENLKRDIAMGRFVVGDKLTETGVATRMGISPTPVREAFKRLESEGFIISEPYKGVVVRGYSLEETRHAYLARARLEALALKLVLEKMTEDDAIALESLIGQGVGSATDDMLSRFAPFHEWVIEKAESQIVYGMLVSINAHINIHRAKKHLLNLDEKKFLEAHILLLEYVKTGEFKLAEHQMEQIILEVFKGLVL